MKRKYIELKIDEANTRAEKAKHDRAVACREKAILLKENAAIRRELATAQRKLLDVDKVISALQVETHDFEEKNAETEKQLKKLKRELEETKVENQQTETKCSVVEQENATLRHDLIETEKKATAMERKVEEADAVLKKTKNEAEAEREKDDKYADMKNKLSKMQVERDIDDKVITSAFTQVVQLQRDLEQAKMNTKETNKTECKADQRLNGCSKELVSRIESDIVDNSTVTMDDIAGLEFAKKCVNELIVWPMSRPDIFTGLRALPRGLLLFGPPGTGKTMIGKAIASQSGATFFYISASSIGSKWAGESEHLVRTLFAVAAAKQPSVIFIDEIDSMLTKRSDDDSGWRRAIKTEFMVQLDGMSPTSNDSVLIIGATNCPHSLDEAIRRRFVKRMYIPLPCREARAEYMKHALKDDKHDLSADDFKHVAESTKGYSCADMHALCTEAALSPIRAIVDIRTAKVEDIRAIRYQDFVLAMESVKASVGCKDMKVFEDWNAEFGSF